MAECNNKKELFSAHKHLVHNFDRVEDDLRREKFGYLHTQKPHVVEQSLRKVYAKRVQGVSPVAMNRLADKDILKLDALKSRLFPVIDYKAMKSLVRENAEYEMAKPGATDQINRVERRILNN